ncbi:hypothetical protein GCM10010219_24950 [Streptomyces netropsis]|nr:hypothetical protein GCM10010219_24950 [Streptomyces netropsis]
MAWVAVDSALPDRAVVVARRGGGEESPGPAPSRIRGSAPDPVGRGLPQGRDGG